MNAIKLMLLATALAFHNMAFADINIGVVLSLTGPGASLGIQERNAITMIPSTIGYEKLNITVLDDESDPAKAIRNAKKLIAENNIDVLIGSSLSPISIALVDVAAEAKIPMISPSASPQIVAPMNEKRRWAFKTTQNDALMAEEVISHIKSAGLRSVAFIGQGDSYGEGWYQEVAKHASLQGIEMVASERYARTDTSATAQVLKVLAAQPDAVVIAAAGTPSLLPHIALIDRQYKGRIYQSHGAANLKFLELGGKKVENTFLAVGPMLVAEQLPQSSPVRDVALEFVKAYDTKFGAGSRSTFAGHAWDAWLLLNRAIPEALKHGKPGTQEFRDKLRDSVEETKQFIGTHGVFNMTPQDHMGLDRRAAVMVEVKNGKWVLAQ